MEEKSYKLFLFQKKTLPNNLKYKKIFLGILKNLLVFINTHMKTPFSKSYLEYIDKKRNIQVRRHFLLWEEHCKKYCPFFLKKGRVSKPKNYY